MVGRGSVRQRSGGGAVRRGGGGLISLSSRSRSSSECATVAAEAVAAAAAAASGGHASSSSAGTSTSSDAEGGRTGAAGGIGALSDVRRPRGDVVLDAASFDNERAGPRGDVVLDAASFARGRAGPRGDGVGAFGREGCCGGRGAGGRDTEGVRSTVAGRGSDGSDCMRRISGPPAAAASSRGAEGTRGATAPDAVSPTSRKGSSLGCLRTDLSDDSRCSMKLARLAMAGLSRRRVAVFRTVVLSTLARHKTTTWQVGHADATGASAVAAAAAASPPLSTHPPEKYLDEGRLDSDAGMGGAQCTRR